MSLAPPSLGGVTPTFDPFAMLDRQARAMEHEIDAMMAQGGFGAIPVVAGPGVCMQSVQITYQGNGQAPHVVSRTAGECGAAHSAVPTELPATPERQHAPAVIQARAAIPYQGMVHRISDVAR